MDAQDTSACPCGFRCESCGSTGPGLMVKIYDVLGADVVPHRVLRL